MKSIKQCFTITLPEDQGYMDLTDDLRELVRRANVHDGLCVINAMDVTASVVTATNNPEELDKYMKFYDKLTTLAEEDARAALKHQLAGNGVTCTIIDGELELGLSQYIIYMDFAGNIEKTVSISIIGE